MILILDQKIVIASMPIANDDSLNTALQQREAKKNAYGIFLPKECINQCYKLKKNEQQLLSNTIAWSTVLLAGVPQISANAVVAH
jgi:hypothetical protein